jgi:hypothetical protein
MDISLHKSTKSTYPPPDHPHLGTSWTNCGLVHKPKKAKNKGSGDNVDNVDKTPGEKGDEPPEYVEL